MRDVTTGSGAGRADRDDAHPVERIIQLLHNERLSAQLDLPPGPDRYAAARAAIADLATAWELPLLRSQRWLVAAEGLLQGEASVELFVQLDRVSSIVTIELWQGSARVFGIDDWVGF